MALCIMQLGKRVNLIPQGLTGLVVRKRTMYAHLHNQPGKKCTARESQNDHGKLACSKCHSLFLPYKKAVYFIFLKKS